MESIVQFTTVNPSATAPAWAEIIVVANGCTDETKFFVQDMQSKFNNIRLLWFDEAIGFTKAGNEGIKAARGEYVVLLNNDVVLLPQQYNEWLQIMVAPFETDPKVGVTGPMKEISTCDRAFVLFFCAMIPKKLIDEIGLMDEIFSPGYGEDTDLCCRIEDAGYKIVQVPDETNTYYATNRKVGNFPLYHAGNVTFRDHPDAALIHRNNDILKERYGKKGGTVSTLSPHELPPIATTSATTVDISKALVCDGYMTDKELTWLAETARNTKLFIEVGSWHGRSSRAIADNLPEGGRLICVDTWNGSLGEQDTHHASARWMDGDHAFDEFCRNNFDHIEAGRLIPLRMHSKNAANLLRDKGVKAQAVFIDAGHHEEEVKLDIAFWLPVVEEGGVLCGHDYYHIGSDGNNNWPGVQRAVDHFFHHKGTDMGYIEGNSIWRHVIGIKKEVQPRSRQVFDCFTFNNEVDLLEVRFNELYGIVDRFVIVESMFTHSGRPKELTFEKHLHRFAPFMHKVSYFVVPEFEQKGTSSDDNWARERHQRNVIMELLTDCQDDDVIIISDLDEIPASDAIRLYDSSKGITSFEQTLYYYNITVQAADKWLDAKILPYKELKTLTPCGARYHVATNKLENGGWHFSYFGGIAAIQEKIKNTAHQEYNNAVNLDPLTIKKRVENAEDVFGRPHINFIKTTDTTSLPQFVKDNLARFI